MTGKVSGIALFSIATGSIFVWSGLKGWSVLNTVADIITGKKPSANNSNLYPLTSASNGQGYAGGNSSTIASQALTYRGHAYKYGGAPGLNGIQPWDCSSFVNWVIGHDLGMAIPGYSAGQYDGSVHGPPTGSWAVWNGLTHIQQSQVQEGDLIIWFNHMGIAINNTQMISALDPQLGTQVSAIQGAASGPILVYGRLN